MGKPRIPQTAKQAVQVITTPQATPQKKEEPAKPQKPTIPLTHRSESFKLIVEAELEKKIRLLCDRLPRNEYSGTLFYTVTGTFENKDLTIHAKDFYLQDIGSGGYTEFQHDTSLAGYMVDHELWDCYTGLMHSHNQMSTFFSGTDVDTLRSEGTEQNHFVSLIVNNVGKYSAAVTRKVHTKMVKRVSGSRSDAYKSWDVKTLVNEDRPFSSEESTEGDYFEYFNLEVEVEKASYEKTELELRLEELTKSAKSFINHSFNPTPSTRIGYTPQSHIIPEISHPATSQPTSQTPPLKINDDPILFDKEAWRNLEKVEFADPEENWYVDYEKDHIDREIIENHVKQIVSGNIFAHMQKKFDLELWGKNMERVYDKRFGTANDKETDCYENFQIFADSIIELLNTEVTEFDMVNPSDRALLSATDYVDAVWANDLCLALAKVPTNRYVKYFIESLERWKI